MKVGTKLRRFGKDNFHALTHKNFRYYWSGQCISLIGTWMQNIGQSWLVFTLTGSPFLLGLVGTIQFLPITLFSLFAGVLVDKFPKKKILIITQSISMILALTLSILVFTHTVKYSYVLILALILGITNTLDMPTRQSFVVEVVGKEDLMNAIALNSAIFNLARILGPSIGALIMALLGAGWCFLLNGISFIAVIYGLIKIKPTPYVRKNNSESKIIKEVKDGLIYIFNNTELLRTVLIVTVMGIFAFNYSVLLPVFTKNVLHKSEGTYGFLMAALGTGSLIGAITVSLKSKSGPKYSILLISSIIVSIMLVFTGVSKYQYIAAVSLAITGIFNIYFSTTANSTLQMRSKDEYRGRVMSVYALVFSGTTPIGNLYAGTVADKLGASSAFVTSGILSILLILILMLGFNKIRNKEL